MIRKRIGINKEITAEPARGGFVATVYQYDSESGWNMIDADDEQVFDTEPLAIEHGLIVFADYINPAYFTADHIDEVQS